MEIGWMTRRNGLFWIRWTAMVVLLIGCRGLLPAQGKIKFDRTRHDFGEVKEEKGLARVEFTYHNVGTQPLKVIGAKATCGCTTPDWTRDSILPGDSGYVRVAYNPAGRPGVFGKEILVETDGAPQYVTLTIHGRVTPRPKGPVDFYPFEDGSLRFRTNHLTYGALYKDDTATNSTILYNQGQKPIQFSKSSSKVPGHLKPRLTKTTLAPGDTLTLFVKYIANDKKDWGFAYDEIMLSTNDGSRPMKTIKISADIKERFSPADRAKAPNLTLPTTKVDLGSVPEGTMPVATFEFTNTGKSPLVMRKFSAACSCISVDGPAVTEPGATGTLRLKFNTAGRVGEFEKDAVLITNDPDHPETILQISGTVTREGEDGQD